jgi:subtilisin family serine protease
MVNSWYNNLQDWTRGYRVICTAWLVLVTAVVEPASAMQRKPAASIQYQKERVAGRMAIPRRGPAPPPLSGRMTGDEYVRWALARLGYEVVSGNVESQANGLPIYRYREMQAGPIAARIPNDQLFGLFQYDKRIMNAPGAWFHSTGNLSVKIAILDSGVDAFHPEFRGKLLPGFSLLDNPTNLSDVNGHGTAVAGVAAAAGNNGSGIAGMAWQNPIIPVRIATREGSTTSTLVAAGLMWAVDNGARVLNVSYGPLQGDQVVIAAARYVRSKGGLVFLSSGNTPAVNPAPLEDSEVFVGATDGLDRLAPFSTRGAAVQLLAPGVDIPTTLSGGGYALANGTSFAAPNAAGVAGLIWALNPSLTPLQVLQILRSTAKNIGATDAGRVDAGAALLMAANQLSQTPRPSPITVPFILSPSPNSTLQGVATVEVGIVTTDGPVSEAVVQSVAVLLDGVDVAERPNMSSSVGAVFNIDVTSRTLGGLHQISARIIFADGSSALSNPVPVQILTDDTNHFVGKLFRSVLGRPVDAAGLQFFGGITRSAGRTATAQQLLASSEARRRIGATLYQRVLRRPLEPAAGPFVESALSSGTQQQLESILLGSAEYFSRFASLDAFVNGVYIDVLQRTAESRARVQAVAALNGGLSRDRYALGVLLSQEANELLISDLFDDLLGRSPDEGGLAYFAGLLRAGTRVETVTAAILGSAEYLSLR